MTFTDEDLERLKNETPLDHTCIHHGRSVNLGALIARLEAAEKCIPYHECQDDLSTCPHLKAWRKEAGK